mmetsp:Transcript_24602/g.39638  ORF Transcript_24602/g.39638 Transcript_24602/m.39638 type:complete len:247 (+) Transcript_24602:1618-2358(+)
MFHFDSRHLWRACCGTTCWNRQGRVLRLCVHCRCNWRSFGNGNIHNNSKQVGIIIRDFDCLLGLDGSRVVAICVPWQYIQQPHHDVATIAVCACTLHSLLLSAAYAVSVGLAVAVILVAVSNCTATQLAANRTVPLPIHPRTARLGVHVVANRFGQTVLAKTTCAVLVAASKHARCSHLDVLAEVTVFVVFCGLRARSRAMHHVKAACCSAHAAPCHTSCTVASSVHGSKRQTRRLCSDVGNASMR